MSAIRIRTTLTSETLHLPELRPLIGRPVEIIVVEETPPAAQPGTGNWEAALKAVESLRESGFDSEAVGDQREYDRRHAEDHLK